MRRLPATHAMIDRLTGRAFLKLALLSVFALMVSTSALAAAVALYFVLERVMPPAAAAAILAAALGLAALVLFIAFKRASLSPLPPEAGRPGEGRPGEGLGRDDAPPEVLLLNEACKAIRRHPGSAMLIALVGGAALGASPALQDILKNALNDLERR